MDNKHYYNKRLANLTGGVAVINVGAPTEVEMKEKKDRIDDAVEAVRAAIDRGLSIGGGYTFVQVVNKFYKEELTAGEHLILSALLKPLEQLCLNSDSSYEDVMAKILEGNGYDVISDNHYSLDEYKVYDPTGVLIDSLTNAVSVAKSILSIECSVFN